MEKKTTFFTLVEVEVTHEQGEVYGYEFVDDESIFKEAAKHAKEMFEQEQEQERMKNENLTL